MDKSRRNLTDRLYERGVPLERFEKRGYVLDDVEFDQPIAADEPVQQSTANATSYFHYENTSHALLCGQIAGMQNAPETLQDVADTVADRALLQVGTWGKYMQQVGPGNQVSPEVQEYYRLLYREQDPVMKLLGILTIDTADVGVWRRFRSDADDVFAKISSAFNQPTYVMLAEPLRDHILSLDMTRRRELLQRSAQYIDLIGHTVAKIEDSTFAPLGFDMQDAFQMTGEPVKQFYDDIRLTTALDE